MSKLSTTITRKFTSSYDLSDFEIETDTGWEDVTVVHETVPYTEWIIKTESGLILKCADTHILFDHNMNEIFAKDLQPYISYVQTIHGPELVISVDNTGVDTPMYDITVDSPNHRFYSNGFLSHNTTIVNALSYALYGVALTRIKKDNLINKSNAKNMVVSVEFEINGQVYRIERGRRPAVLRFWAGNTEMDVDNEAQGDSRETQKAIEEIIGMTHDMFKHIVALNTYTEPFLSLNSNNQRIFIEQLLGITLLSEKGEHLKEISRATKRQIADIEASIAANIDANKRIQEQIDSLERRSKQWEKAKEKALLEMADALAALEEIDIDSELKAHTQLAEWNDANALLQTKQSELDVLQAQLPKLRRQITRLEKDIAVLNEKTCHTCGQPFHGDKHESILLEKGTQLSEALSELENVSEAVEQLIAEVDNLQVTLPTKPIVFYNNIQDAYSHKTSMQSLMTEIENKANEKNPYTEQIADMKEQALIDIDYTELNEFTRLHEHQEFLYKLLTNKDSFIRKRIIEQNLAHLNARLSHYLDEMGLPHQVQFINDLSVEITEFGRDLDFDNLSRGERNRLILSLSWAFRDVWEALYQPINLVFIDELVDSGLDTKGVDCALKVLKKMARDRGKSVWLVSHRDELISRVSRILRVIKENGYTSFDQDVD